MAVTDRALITLGVLAGIACTPDPVDGSGGPPVAGSVPWTSASDGWRPSGSRLDRKSTRLNSSH